MKRARILIRLEEKIKTARNILAADCLRAERAYYLVRVGRFKEVQVELDCLRTRNTEQKNVEISAWLNLVEGLQAYFSTVGSTKTDKIKRSFALSSAFGLRELQALSSAWIAQFDYVRFDMDSMAKHARLSLQLASPSNYSARSRSSLVVAQALHLAGRPDLSFAWYRSAREYAVCEGDDATIGALMHNMGWLRMMTLRKSVLSGRGDMLEPDHALMNSESTTQFDALVGDSSWNELKPILRAQILSLKGRFSEALKLYEGHLEKVVSDGVIRLQANLLADKAWCLIKCGQSELAAVCAKQAQMNINCDVRLDDRAAAHSRLAQTFSELLDHKARDEHSKLAEDAWNSYEAVQARIIVLLGNLKNADFEGPSLVI
jgi:hypothetical protein